MEQPLHNVRDRIEHAARVAGRQPQDITLIAVSKTHEAEAIAPLIAQGQRVFGENRVQEAQAKWPALRSTHGPIELHLVGQLQSNKAEEAAALFDCIHSLDRPSLVAALAKAMDRAGREVPCFVQVNIGAEEQKGGCAIAALPAGISAIHVGSFATVVEPIAATLRALVTEQPVQGRGWTLLSFTEIRGAEQIAAGHVSPRARCRNRLPSS